MKAVLWPYRFKDMMQSWGRQVRWVVAALQARGVTVLRHHEVLCPGLEDLQVYNLYKDRDADLVIYNHADAGELDQNCLPAKHNWFLKPTVPDNLQCTLDTLGYGPFSEPTLKRPDFESVTDAEVQAFFDTKVKAWLESKITKWADAYKPQPVKLDFEGYWLVLGQCQGDTVVTRMSFGNHADKLAQVVGALLKYSERPVVVKLHPYMDGREAKDDKFSAAYQARLERMGPRVKVFRGISSIHDFLPGAHAVLLENSGSGFEAMMHHKPIICWGWPEYHWTSYSLRLLPELAMALKLQWFNAGAQDRFLCWYMNHYCFSDETSADRRVEELLKCRSR